MAINVQQTIIKGIRDQLFSNDYLVLPGFGGFVLKVRGAHFSTSGGSLVPPSKSVSFNSQLKQNDGVLSLWLQDQLACSSENATTHIKDFTEFCSSILQTKRRLNLDGIGFFYLDFENNICFEPQADANFLSSSFGLGPVSIKALEPAKDQGKTVFADRGVKEVLERNESPVIDTPPIQKRRWVVPALLVLVLFSLFGLVLINNRIAGELQAGLFNGNSSGTYRPVNYDKLNLVPSVDASNSYVADANGVANLKLGENKTIAVKAIEREMSSKKGNYEIVMGCFSVLNNANRMVKKLSLSHLQAQVAGTNAKGMYVVSHGSFISKNDAVVVLQSLKSRYPQAWIKEQH